MNIMDLVDDYGVKNLFITANSDSGLVRLDIIPKCDLFNNVCNIVCNWEDRFGPEALFIPGYPKPMLTDLATVPKMFQSFQSAFGKISIPAIFHDGLYQYRPVLANGIRIGRAESDYLLYYACINIGGMAEDDARHVFEAVRIGGSVIWHKHDDEFEDA
jgi:hypothetical protein